MVGSHMGSSRGSSRHDKATDVTAGDCLPPPCRVLRVNELPSV